MSISVSDVKIMRPERVTDNADGGGAMTGTEIASGDVNNVWDDVPRSTLAYGGVSLRKLFCAIRSANVDKFLGAHAIISKDSASENVSTLLFSTGDHFDERASAQDAVEQFVVLGTRSPLRPVGTQRQGQLAVVMYSDNEADAPRVGSVLVFNNEGLGIEQYVKISEVTYQPQTYTYEDKSGELRQYRAIEFTIQLTQPLLHDFSGQDPAPSAKHATSVYKTQPASAARYYGVKPLVKTALSGESTVSVDGIFQSIVPTATTETALLDRKPGIASKVVQPASAVKYVRSFGSHSGTVSFTLPQAFVPGSLTLTVAGSEYKDRAGTLELVSGVDRLTSASVDPKAGVLSLEMTGSGTVSAEYLPGVPVELTPYTASVPIDFSNRQLTYTAQLAPEPMPGSLRIEYQYLGEWYEVLDNGAGEIVGEGASGQVRYDTGSVSVSLPAEPDQGSEILYTWSRSPYSSELADAPLAGEFLIELPDEAVVGSVTINWGAYTATEQADRSLTGDATGAVEGNVIRITPANGKLPAGDFAISYSKATDAVQEYQAQLSNRVSGTQSFNLGQQNILASSVKFDLLTSFVVKSNVGGVETDSRFTRMLQMRGRDDGALYNIENGHRIVVGTIDAVQGIVTVNMAALQYVAGDYIKPSQSEELGGGKFVSVTRTREIEAQNVVIRYRLGDAGSPANYTASLAALEVNIPLRNNYLVPGGLMFTIDDDLIVDRGDGVLYSAWNDQTAAGIQVGQVNYATSELILNYQQLQINISNLNISMLAYAAGVGAAAAVNEVSFRTPASPLRPSGLQFLARSAVDGALLRAESQSDGSLSGSFDSSNTLDALPQPGSVSGYSLPIVVDGPTSGTATGSVDYQTGVVKISFSKPVILSSLTFNAVAYNTVPLDPDVLGLNPVKLPTNGQVPIFQPAYMCVVHNSKDIALATPSAGQVINCGRQNIAQALIHDANGAALALDKYSVDKVAGTVTLTDPFNAVDSQGTSLVLPLTVQHRIEDVCVIGRVAIDGTLNLITPLTNDYPANESYVSSAILFGDLQARVYGLFSQKVDEAEFYDDLRGDKSTASYDDNNYPVLVDNLSSIKERWKIKFTSSTAFVLMGETLGVVGTGSINADFSPINPMTQQPYFTIRSAGWGAGWVTSNILRFNTEAAAAPLWAVRTVLPSNTKIEKDSIQIEFRGDAD